MGRNQFFEAALVLAIIGLTGMLYVAVATTPPAHDSWETSANGSIDYMFVGSDDTLYAFSGNEITAVAKDGSRLWNLTVPSEWALLNDWKIPAFNNYGDNSGVYSNYPVACENAGTIYVYASGRPLREDIDNAWISPDNKLYYNPYAVFAISPDGIILWKHLIPGNVSAITLRMMDDHRVSMLDSPAIRVSGERVYVFHDFSEDVLDSGGRLLLTLSNITAPVAVDEAGRMYSVRGIASPPDPDAYYRPFIRPDLALRPEYKYLVPTSMIDAYNPDGSLDWTMDIGLNATIIYVTPDLWPRYNSIPLYENHTLYVPVYKGFVTISTDGRLQWVRQIENRVGRDVEMVPEGNVRTFIVTNASGGDYDPGGRYVPLSIMPIDSSGYAYLAPVFEQWNASAIRVMAPAGAVSVPANVTGTNSMYGRDGVIYSLDTPSVWTLAEALLHPDTMKLNESYPGKEIEAGTVNAFDLKSDARLWNFPVTMQNISTVLLNASNVRNVLPYYALDYVRDVNENGAGYGDLAPTSGGGYGTGSSAEIFPGKDVVYVSYYYCVYETPTIYNRSRGAYVNTIYALDKSGRLLWEKPVDGIVTRAAAGNGTIYYLTSSGKMGGGTAGVAAGVAILAAAYLFLRFFMVGAVARARTRLEQNDNRKQVLRYIIDNPGVTAVDVSRGLGMNIGTIRYHLFVLSMNHKIVYHKEDEKYLRYFTNSGTYTAEERVILSLLRRESLHRMLRLMMESPGLTSLEMSQRLGVSTTVAHRHINELMDRDVVVKVCGTEKGNVYLINEKYRDITATTLGREPL